MWQELVWNLDFLRGLIFFALAILVAIFLIPRILKRLQAERDKRLAKALLKRWGADCIGAIELVMPHTTQRVQVKENGSVHECSREVEIKEDGSLVESSDGLAVNLTIHQLWDDIRQGKRQPDGSAMVINNVLDKVLFSEEERAQKELPLDKTYSLQNIWGGQRDVPKAFISRILNPMYAKLEIFDLELLPISELEQAMQHLEFFRQRGYVSRYDFMSYGLHLAQSMEKFAKYLWKLENWSNKAKTQNRS